MVLLGRFGQRERQRSDLRLGNHRLVQTITRPIVETVPAVMARTLLCVRAPIRVVFTDHAAERAVRYGISYENIADAVLDNHESRQRNPGSGDWLVRQGRLAVIYDWPDGEDATAARVVTVWRQE
jgi:hypothetical protein